jgi:hypothetical protein
MPRASSRPGLKKTQTGGVRFLRTRNKQKQSVPPAHILDALSLLLIFEDCPDRTHPFFAMRCLELFPPLLLLSVLLHAQLQPQSAVTAPLRTQRNKKPFRNIFWRLCFFSGPMKKEGLLIKAFFAFICPIPLTSKSKYIKKKKKRKERKEEKGIKGWEMRK